MRNMRMAAILLATIALSAFAQDPKCDCTIVPFKPSPPCLDRCCAKVLSTSTFEELQLILGVQRDMARRIVEWKERQKAKTLEEFEKVLSHDEIEEISGRINSLNESQLHYFNKSQAERLAVTDRMKLLFMEGAKKKQRPIPR